MSAPASSARPPVSSAVSVSFPRWRQTRLRRALFQVHLWSGLVLGLYLLVIGVTGSAVVSRSEIEDALRPRLTRVPIAVERAPVQPMLEAAQREFPGARFHTVNLPRQAGHSLSFWGRDAQGRSFHVFFNPHTGALLGHDLAGDNLTEWLYELHANLLSGHTGQQVNGIGGLLCVVLLLTGVAVWWPGRGQIVRQGLMIRWRARWKRLNYDLHKVVGIVSVSLLLLVAVTGVWFPFKAPFRWAAEKLTGTSAHEDSPKAAPADPETARITIDQALRAAEAVLPGVPPNWVGLPEQPDDVYTVRKRLPGEWRLEGMNHIHVDPYTGAVVRADLHAERTPAQRILRAMFPLHAGTFGGLATRILWVILGLAPALLFVTGFLMWWNRVVRPLRSPVPRAAPGCCASLTNDPTDPADQVITL